MNCVRLIKAGYANNANKKGRTMNWPINEGRVRMRYLQTIVLTLLVGVLPTVGAPALADDAGPLIDHAPLETAVVEGEEVSLSAFVEDEDGVDEVYLFTRSSELSSSGFNTQGYFCTSTAVCKGGANMEMSSDGEVKYSFETGGLKVPGLDYYWLAIDGKGQQEQDGSEDDFYQLEVSPSALIEQAAAPTQTSVSEELSSARKTPVWMYFVGAVAIGAVVAAAGGSDGSSASTDVPANQILFR
jgi:hypothetical protein